VLPLLTLKSAKALAANFTSCQLAMGGYGLSGLGCLRLLVGARATATQLPNCAAPAK